MLAKPDTPGFFVGKPLTSPKAEESEAAKLKILLYISLFAMFTDLLIVGAMLVPGLTLSWYLTTLSILQREYPVILTLMRITQAVFIQYSQEMESRNLMCELNNHHLAVLKEELLPAAKRPRVSRAGASGRSQARVPATQDGKADGAEFF